MFDLKVLETKENIINVLNNSGLPITVIQMIINEIKHTVDLQTMISLENQKKEVNKETNKEVNKETNKKANNDENKEEQKR